MNPWQEQVAHLQCITKYYFNKSLLHRASRSLQWASFLSVLMKFLNKTTYFMIYIYVYS